MPSLFRHVTPVDPADATGSVAAVYDQVNAEFSSIGPAIMLLSPAPELLAPGWALFREALMAGTVPRWRKEIVTVSVSAANKCGYDVAGHLMFLRLAGGDHVADALEGDEDPAEEDLAALARWARATGSPGSADLVAPFTADQAPEYIGTALALHFINRLVLTLLARDLHPGSMRENEPSAFDGAPIARAIRQHRTPGESLRLIANRPTGPIPIWAADSPVGTAYAALRTAARAGGGLLSEPAQAAVAATIGELRGLHLATDRHWLDAALARLEPGDRPGAALAILAGLAADQITDDDVAAWRTGQYTDHCLLHLLGYGVFTVVECIESDIAAVLV